MKKVKLKLELQYNSPVILTFFLLSLLVLFLDQWTDGWTTMHLFCVYRSSLKDPLFYIRLFGHVLGHASWDHFLNNMLLVAALYFGQQVYDIIFVHDNVANFMHIVGGLCGTAFGYYSALHSRRRPAKAVKFSSTNSRRKR